MQKYKDWAPMSLDQKGLNLPDHQEWFVLYGRSRDSDPIQESNFRVLCDMLNEKDSESVGIFRFNHWACGWIEVMLVEPDSSAYEKAKELQQIIADEGYLDDNDVVEIQIERGLYDEDEETDSYEEE